MLTQTEWLEIQQSYETGQSTVSDLARDYDVSRTTIQYRKDRDGWVKRSLTDGQSNNLIAIAKMRAIAMRELDMLEKETAPDNECLCLADREKLTRIMTGLVKLLEGISDLEHRMGQLSRDAEGKDNTADMDDDAMRENIAGRIEQLRRQHREGSSSKIAET